MEHPKCLTVGSIERDLAEANVIEGGPVESDFMEEGSTKTDSTYVEPTKELQHLQFEKTKDHYIVQDTRDTSSPMYYHEPLQTKSISIGIEEELKLLVIGDYWVEHAVAKIVALLYKYANLFPRSFTEMKYVLG
jgi:hypothetical protein